MQLELSRQASMDRKKFEEKQNRRRRTTVKGAISKPLATLKGLSKRESGECVTNKDFMLSNCCHSCEQWKLTTKHEL